MNDELRCACPVHGGDNSTAFSYSLTFKRWRCFTGHCHEDRDSIFGLVQAILSHKEEREVGFRESAIWLSELLDIPIEGEHQINEIQLEIQKLNSQAKLQNRIREKTKQTNKREKFSPIPISAISGKIQPSWYFKELGFTDEILRKYNVGYCDDQYKPMYLRSYAPVLDETGKMVLGVTGRIRFEKCEVCGDFHDPKSNGCPKDDPTIKAYAKWMHYGFNSNSVLYNSWFAEPYIKKSGTAILLEGPKDVWWLEQHGVHNSLCIFGLNVYDYHISKLIHMGATKIIVALDNDEKGIEAAEKLDQTLGNYFKLFNVKNLLKTDEDIADVSSERIENVITPYIKSLENKEICQIN